MAPVILVVGGGIGGLSLVNALARRGIRCELVEREPTWTTVGAGIALYPNGLRALGALRLDVAVEQAGAVIRRVRTMDRVGAVLGDFPGEAWEGVGVTVAIHRPVLQRLLVEAVDTSCVDVRMGTTVRGFEPAHDGVEVEFTDGRAGRYDLVVGADGIRSAVRTLVFGERRPRYVGQMYWRTSVAADLVECSTMLFDRDRFVALLPVGGGITYVAAQLHTDEPFDELPSGRIAHVRALFDDFGGPVPDALAAIDDPDAVHFGPAEEIDHDDWRRDRVVLIGDAAHACSPTLAQGGSLAIEDAIVLAELLSQRGDIDRALDAFVARRAPRATWVRQRTHRQIELLNAGAPHEHLAAGMRETYAELARPV
jgi:2-polyprenyl-6-methoxyphenol hydroxylase-like FAD-dependent oxidoreductase